jgi:integrase
MAQILHEAPLTTASARSKLAPGTYWRRVDPDVHLGYRKQVRGGRWLVRWYKGKGAYEQVTLATADDAIEADGATTLTFSDAERRARKTVEKRRAEMAAKEKAEVQAADGPLITVRRAIEEYLTERDAHRDVRFRQHDAQSRLINHVLKAGGNLADKPLAQLKEQGLMDWRAGLNVGPATRQRIRNDFRAALNRAAFRYRSKLPPEIPAIIKFGFKSSEPVPDAAREIQVLPDGDVRRVVQTAQEIDKEDGWNGDLFRLILVLAATGARFSQIARMKVSEVQFDRNRLMIPVSRKGQGVKAVKQIGVRVGEDVINALRPAIAGRRGPELLFLRPKRTQTRANQRQATHREPWRAASELTPSWDKIRQRVGLPAEIVAYSLRHSSIVRGLRAGLPVQLVAKLHDTSVKMIETHYAAYISDALDELAVRAVVPLAPAETAANIVALPRRVS